MGLSLGIDTGGTCTDAVLLDEQQRVVASAKALTTHGALIHGLERAADKVLAEINSCDVDLVSLSTTLATNAVVEGQGRAVGLILVGFSPSWLERAQLGEALGSDRVLFVAGGHTACGDEAEPLDLDALATSLGDDHDSIEAWAVSAVFAVRNPDHEQRVAAYLRSVTGKPVSLGHQLSSGLDAPRRALTALLNARLIPSIVELLDAAARLLRERGIDAPVMVVKGDGTLISEAVARQLPVETVLSGPAASVVAAGTLGPIQSAIVVDIGGTTSDIAVLEDGLPRLDPQGAEVGGWRTMVQAVDVASVGIGGDSELHLTSDGDVRVGPRRAVPLSLLAAENERVIPWLESQWARGWSMSHDAQFVLALPVGGRRPRSAGQRELLARISADGIPLEHLFEGRTEALALQRLEADGFVRRAAFTPTDASHVLGLQSTWDQGAAALGARLWLRQLRDRGARAERRLAAVESTADEVLAARIACLAVEHASAVAVAERVMRLSVETSRRDREIAAWVADELQASQMAGLREPSPEAVAPVAMQVDLRVSAPLFGLGASSGIYHPGTARLLGMACEVPTEAGVANAIGAVSGVVRQVRSLRVLPAGGEAVSVLFPEGPRRFDDLASAAREAEPCVIAMARSAALAAGVMSDESALVVTCTRHDNVVEQDGHKVFVESELRAVATGRPARFNASDAS